MNEQLITSLRAELAYLEETNNPRARQVRARLAEETGEPMEDAAPKVPQEKAVPAKRGPGRPRKDT